MAKAGAVFLCGTYHMHNVISQGMDLGMAFALLARGFCDHVVAFAIPWTVYSGPASMHASHIACCRSLLHLNPCRGGGHGRPPQRHPVRLRPPLTLAYPCRCIHQVLPHGASTTGCAARCVDERLCCTVRRQHIGHNKPSLSATRPLINASNSAEAAFLRNVSSGALARQAARMAQWPMEQDLVASGLQ